ncbi:Similar to hypothetical protein AOL_s00097g618 [Arthrobotrys oligospora ATCC 24927]; acc. no. EGX46602 [Pyronema omphalodes CBS 100304]|uniref:Uncharacterized protein n=1 Tax=Pyronema omphalodes (strain CBS 100304) TaxID=1076935 RepID=U4LDS1_PYROM|nr:Similar to hypothetical protein AOL_s00097g618 [Arthrobotrys oligospora ATCC 24927]; acc. no. EGX46602 [Pyronema omphalodes CBS 100304]
MDRLKEIGSSAREKAGLAPKKSYHNYSDSRISTAKTHPDTLSKIKGLVPDRVTGIVSRGRSGSNSSQDSAPSSYRSHTVVDPASFGPPPKHRAAYGDEIASASIAGGAPPPYDSPPGAPLQRRATIEAPESRRAPPPPPRIPSRRGTESYPASREVTDEDVASRGGLSTGAVGALGQLGKSGIHIPGFGTSKETAPPPPPTSSRPKIGSTASRWRTNSDAAPTGTTLEEKKAAVKTIDQLYKDPTKVSFKDAKAAAGTARNFQQRHGGQVAEGARLANKYGLIGNEMTREPTQQSDIRTPPSPQSPQHVKYEPPPPPRRSVPSTPTAPDRHQLLQHNTIRHRLHKDLYHPRYQLGNPHHLYPPNEEASPTITSYYRITAPTSSRSYLISTASDTANISSFAVFRILANFVFRLLSAEFRIPATSNSRAPS